MKLAYHPTTIEVLAYCATPRTIAEIVEHAGSDGQRARIAVYNLRRRGLLTNLNAENAAARAPGVFVAAGQAVRADVMQGAGLSFSAMAAFGGQQA